MRRALVFLLALSVRVAAEEPGDWVKRLASESPTEREAAIDALWGAGPEADAALAEAGRGNGPAADTARQLVAARRWDSERAVGDLSLLGGLDDEDATARVDFQRQLAALGSAVAGRAMDRLFAAADDRRAEELLDALQYVQGRDPGWGRLACRMLESRAEEVRAAAVLALMHSAGRPQVGALRVAAGREPSAPLRSRILACLYQSACFPEDLPPLPDDPEAYSLALETMSQGGAPELRSAAWEAFRRRRPSEIPPSFWSEPAKLLAHVSEDEFAEGLRWMSWSRRVPVEARNRLLQSDSARLRAVFASPDDQGPGEFSRVTAMLLDPDVQVRQAVLQAFSHRGMMDDAAPVADQVREMMRLGEAARVFLAASAGASSPEEISIATRELLAAGRHSGPRSMLAYQSFRLAPAEARRAVESLRDDKELGTAAKRVLRMFEFNVSPFNYFGRGFDDNFRVRYLLSPLDIAAWKELLSSKDGDDHRIASDLLQAAWDRIDARDEVAAQTKRLLDDPDGQVAQAASSVLSSRAPALLPSKDDLDPKDSWCRSRSYVLPRLASLIAGTAPLDRQKAMLVVNQGNRSMLMEAVLSGRFEAPDVEPLVINRSSAALVPVLLSRAASLDASLSPWWFTILSSASPAGFRAACAFAREASPPVRAAALQAILSRPWPGGEGEAVMIAACESDDPSSDQAVLLLLRTASQRWRGPFPQGSADALAAFLVRQAASATPPGDLDTLVGWHAMAMSQVSPAGAALLRGNRRVRGVLRDNGADYLEATPPHLRALLGPAGNRSRALSMLPAAKLASVRLILESLLESGGDRETDALYYLQRSGPMVDLALLAWAADRPQDREMLLRLRRRLRQWGSPLPQDFTSRRVADRPVPDEFNGVSENSRDRAAGGAANPDRFQSLCAAAFRGSAGDDIALRAVTPWLGPDALPRIAPLLGAAEPGVRRAAAIAVARVGEAAAPFAKAALRSGLDAEMDRGARELRLAGLARLGGVDGLEGLRALAASKDADDRLASARALAWSPTRDGALLLATLAVDPDFPVAEAAIASLRGMIRRDAETPLAPWDERDWSGWLASHPDATLRDPMTR